VTVLILDAALWQGDVTTRIGSRVFLVGPDVVVVVENELTFDLAFGFMLGVVFCCE
jgi:hypothetical protein